MPIPSSQTQTQLTTSARDSWLQQFILPLALMQSLSTARSFWGHSSGDGSTGLRDTLPWRNCFASCCSLKKLEWWLMLLKWAFLHLKWELLPVQPRATQIRSKISHLGTSSLCMALWSTHHWRSSPSWPHLCHSWPWHPCVTLRQGLAPGGHQDVFSLVS